ncbi:MAG TPA: response regulator [Candidatus Obscuribacterales bacterium]
MAINNCAMRVLIVEDNLLNQKMLQLLVRKNGHECDVVSNGLEAVSAVSRVSYSLILMDIMMPIMDGIEATIEIRKFDQAIPIIAVTALDIAEFEGRALAAGMNDYMTKPISLSILNQKLERWLPKTSNVLELIVDNEIRSAEG